MEKNYEGFFYNKAKKKANKTFNKARKTFNKTMARNITRKPRPAPPLTPAPKTGFKWEPIKNEDLPSFKLWKSNIKKDQEEKLKDEFKKKLKRKKLQLY